MRPVIRTFLHSPKPFMKEVIATLGADFAKPNPFDRIVRGRLSFDGGKLVATAGGLDKSNVVTSLGKANVLIVLPAGARGYEKCMAVTINVLEHQEGTSHAMFPKTGTKRKGV